MDEKPEVDELFEYQDEIYEVESVYEAKRWEGKKLVPVTLVKVVCVDPSPRHVPLDKFLENYKPYDPEAE